jgi:O-antigen ligase
MNTFLQQITKNYYTLLLCAIVFVIPYHIAIPNAFVILLCVLLLKDIFWSKQIAWRTHGQQYVVPFVLLFFFCAISVLYSEDKREAFVMLERKLPFLVVPLALITIQFSRRNIEVVFKAFTISVALCCLVALSLTIVYFSNRPAEYYLEHALWYLPQTIDFHAPYLALYLVVANILCFYFFLHRRNTRFFIFLFLLNNVFLLLISSRTALLANWLFIIVLSTYYLYKSKGIVLTTLNLVGIGAILVIAYFNVPYLHTKISKVTEAAYGVNQRSVSARAAIDVIEKNPLWGVGIGDVQAELEAHLPDETYKGLNVHNQYLQELMAIGWIGFISFASIFWVGFRKGIKHTDIVFLLFLSVFLIAFVTENVISRHKGIMLLSIFYPLFLHLILIRKRESSNTSDRRQVLQSSS